MLPHADIPVDTLLEAAGRPEVVEAMQGFYEEVDRRIAAEKPTCWNRGACCRFGEYGHRLYVTALEVAYYLARRGDGGSLCLPVRGLEEPGASGTALPVIGSPVATNPSLALGASSGDSLLSIGDLTADACPHAYEGRCHARDRRPLGCRIFYCDPNAQHWQGPSTEECLQELKRLHWELGVPYFYADWMAVLRSLHDHGKAQR